MQSQESRYRILFESNVAAVMCHTSAGAIVAVNPACVRLLGLSSAKVASQRSTPEIFCDAEAHAAMREALASQDRDLNRTMRLRRLDGRTIWALVNTARLPDGEDAAVALYESTLIDITESRDLAWRQGQMAKMEGIARLAGGIAHEFNNVLTVINGYSELLLNKAGNEHPLRPGLSQIQQAGQRAERLTRQLMSFSRQSAIEPEALSLTELIQTLAPQLKAILGPAVKLRLGLGSSPYRVHAEADPIGLILQQLAANAHDAMPHGGEFLIELQPIHIDGEYTRRHLQSREGDFIRLMVSDTGNGMAPETREHVYEPFFTTKPKGQGAGMGLATVYGLVQQSRGWIELYSEPGQGTTFKIYLSCATEGRPVAAQIPLLPEARPEGKGEIVLVAEDEVELRDLVQQVLSEAGYQLCGSARDGQEAMEMAPAAGERLDLLVSDVVMPGLAGPGLAEQLRQRHPQTRVLFMSGFTEQTVIHRGLMPEQQRDTDYLQKPFSPAMLLHKVRELLDRPGGVA